MNDEYLKGFQVTPSPSEEALLSKLGSRNGRRFVHGFNVMQSPPPSAALQGGGE